MPHNYLEHAPCLFFAYSTNGILKEVNEKLTSILGYTREELLGKKVETIFTIATKIFQQTHFFPLLSMQGHAEEIFITLQAKDKSHIPVLISAERKEVDGEIVFLHVGIVVNNRKKFEDELIAAKKAAELALSENTALIQTKQELQKHMEQLDRQIHVVNKQNEELKQFNKVVTHDLQEPLRKLSVFSNLLLQHIEDPQKQKANVNKLLNVADQMRNVILGLQQYIWLTEVPLKRKEVDLKMLFLKAKEELGKEFPQVDLQLQTDDLPVVLADEEQVQLLIYELLSNVIRFRKPGQQPFVNVSASSLVHNTFTNLSGKYKYSDFVKLELSDRGIGFDSNYKEQVFDLFGKLHPESGRGIGLSLCKKVIDNHHGKISIDGSEGAGTTVTVLLPLNEKH